MKFFYTLLSLFLVVGFTHGQVRIGGSDLLESHFSAALAEYAEARDLDVSVDFAGSYHGLRGLEKGTIDLSILAIPDGADMPADFRTEHLASKVLVVAVPAANPLNQITMRQLAAIFGEAEASNITRWGQLGLTGEWSSRSISAGWVSSEGDSLLVEFFRHTVLESRGLKRNLTRADDMGAIQERFQQDNNGIVLLDRQPAGAEALKTLSVARSESDLAHLPTLEAVAGGEYPLRLPLYIVYREEDASDLKEVLRFLVSEDAAEAIEASGLTPLPENRRERLFFEFERL